MPPVGTGLQQFQPGDPSQVGGWELLGRLGAGGMGTVYLGRDGARLAAVKVIAAGLGGDATFRDRFRREIEICRRVRGAQVAELYDADPLGSQPWLAVQYIEGPTLSLAIEQHGALSALTLQGFALATAEALHQIHAAGVTHRDLKPSNVILTPETPVIIDFGIAAAAEATALTATGTSMGSAGWMAPEQILGNPCGPATDVFAWGALVAYASTGKPPYGVGRPESLVYRVVHGSPDLDGVPDNYLDLVTRALSVDAGSRPTVPEVLSNLTGHVSPTIDGAIAASWPGDEATEISSTQISQASPVAPSASPRWRRRVAVGTGVTLAAIAAAAVLVLPREVGEPGQRTAATSSTPQSTAPEAAAMSTSPPATSPTTQAPPPDIRSVDLEAEPLQVLCGEGPVSMRGNGEPSVNGTLVVEGFDITYTDVTGDQRDDAIIDVTCGFAGGNGYFSSVAIVSSETAGPRQIGDPIEGAAPTVINSRIVVERPIYMDTDPLCCPSGFEYVPITVGAEEWREGGATKGLAPEDRATTGALGAVRIGDTYQEVAAAVGRVQVQDYAESGGSCLGVTIPSLPEGVSGLGGDGRLRSLEIGNESTRTKSGLGIGSTEAEVQAALGTVRVDPHYYQEGGHYLTYEPDDGSGAVVFDTDGTRVTFYRVGEPAWVAALEGCL